MEIASGNKQTVMSDFRNQNNQSASVSSVESIVDEVAIIFASGETKEAAEMLVKYLNSVKGDTDKKVWFMLLDIFQAINDHKQFDTIAVFYANKFNTSPPSWEGEEKPSSPTPASSGQPEQANQASNSLIVDISLTAKLEGKLKSFVAASREAKTCRLNLGNVKPDRSDVDGFRMLQEAMYMLRKHKVLATLLGDNNLQTYLKTKIESIKENQDTSLTPFWLLYLEILQWRGHSEIFEELALDYAMNYEVSPPGWEEGGVMKIEELAAATNVEDVADAPVGDMIELDDVITDNNFSNLENMIRKKLSDGGKAIVNMSQVKRFDFNAAGAMCAFLSGLGVEQSKIELYHPNELIISLFEIVGASGFFSVIPRKR